MPIRQTHTYSLLYVSEGTYNEIRDLLKEADYDHAFNDKGEIDMHGLALVAKKSKLTNHASTSPGPVNCRIRLQHQNQPWGKTCERCHNGPCPFFHVNGTTREKTPDV